MAKRIVITTLAVTVVITIALQLVPYGWWHENPPVVDDAPWPDARSEALARDACYSCHSNETEWPLYSRVAPVSWLVRRDVERGRDELNFSDWPEASHEVEDAIEQLADDTMPPTPYRLLHPEARLTREERQVLMEALAEM